MNCYFCNKPGELVEPFSNVIECDYCHQGLLLNVRTVYHNDMNVLYAVIDVKHKRIQITVYPNRSLTTILKLDDKEKGYIDMNVIPKDIVDFVEKLDMYILFS